MNLKKAVNSLSWNTPTQKIKVNINDTLERTYILTKNVNDSINVYSTQTRLVHTTDIFSDYVVVEQKESNRVVYFKVCLYAEVVK
jgi:hypothetical protein